MKIKREGHMYVHSSKFFCLARVESHQEGQYEMKQMLSWVDMKWGKSAGKGSENWWSIVSNERNQHLHACALGMWFCKYKS